jgi:hypothetical protein
MDILNKHPEHTECVHSEDDDYMNVINYIRALKGDYFLNELLQGTPEMDKYLLDNILPWLGLTDWNSTSGSKRREGEYGGRTHQMNNFKSKLARFLKQIKKKKRLSQKSAPVPASASVTVPVSEPLEELRAKRYKKEGGKRLNTHKLRRKCKSKSSKRKRMCKN